MSLMKRTGDKAIKYSKDIRKADPKLTNPFNRIAVDLLEWTFPDAVIRSIGQKEQGHPRNENDPANSDGPQP